MKKDRRDLEGLNPEPDGGAGWPGSDAGRRTRARVEARLDVTALHPAPAPASRLRLALMVGAPALVVLLAVGLPLLLLRGGATPETTTGPVAGDSTTTEAATTSEPGATTTTPPTAPEYEFYGTVLDKAGVGPQLCSVVEESLPPQCGGVPVSGLDWADIPWAETAGDTTWAFAHVVGTFDGDTFTLTRLPEAVEGPWPGSGPVPDYTSPCPVPAGGWVVTDPARANQAAMDAVQNYAYEQPDYGGLWIDQLRNGEGGEEADFSAFVLNVTFTGDVAAHEAAIRQMYGGPLCVSRAERSAAELDAVLAELPEVLASPEAAAAGIYAQQAAYYTEVSQAVVVAEVFAVVGDGQAWVDARFGPGVVELHGILRPVGGQAATYPLHLYVSNQSTTVDPVAVTVNVDGRMVVDQEFEFLNMHNWILFELDLAAGEHEVRAMAPAAGADLVETFMVEGEQWAVIDFWADPEENETPRFTWYIQDEPVGFA